MIIYIVSILTFVFLLCISYYLYQLRLKKINKIKHNYSKEIINLVENANKNSPSGGRIPAKFNTYIKNTDIKQIKLFYKDKINLINIEIDGLKKEETKLNDELKLSDNQVNTLRGNTSRNNKMKELVNRQNDLETDDEIKYKLNEALRAKLLELQNKFEEDIEILEQELDSLNRQQINIIDEINYVRDSSSETGWTAGERDPAINLVIEDDQLSEQKEILRKMIIDTELEYGKALSEHKRPDINYLSKSEINKLNNIYNQVNKLRGNTSHQNKINNLVGQQDNIIERRNNIEIQINKQNNLIIFYKNVLDDIIKLEDEMNERISNFLI